MTGSNLEPAAQGVTEPRNLSDPPAILDPFGYWPGQASRLPGLGGDAPPEFPDYVFHTRYVPLNPGWWRAEISFKALKAKNGTMYARIAGHVPAANPPFFEVTVTTALMPVLASSDRPLRLVFEAKEGTQYAVSGFVPGEFEAQARSIDVRVEPFQPPEMRPRSLFGRRMARLARRAHSDQPARLAVPVSQGFTRDQVEEPDFIRWTARLPAALPASERWECAYILRVLEAYGRLQPRAAGLGVAAGDDPVWALADAAGCAITRATLAPGAGDPDALAAALPDGTAPDLFDFLWSRSAVLTGTNWAQTLDWTLRLLDLLKPGGLAIYLMDAVAEPDLPSGGLDANALGRVMLGLVAAGHIVAQIHTPVEADPGVPPERANTAPFGLIVRRTTDQLLS